jgi:uncharacterized membrane protein
MKIKSQRDFWSGLLFLLLGLSFAGASLRHGLGHWALPGRGFFPFGLGLALAVLGAAILFKSLTLEAPAGGAIGPVPWRRLLVVCAALIAFGWLLPRLGVLISVPALVLGLFCADRPLRWRPAVGVASVMTLVVLGLAVALHWALPLWPVSGG